jgi:hypothetical protein
MVTVEGVVSVKVPNMVGKHLEALSCKLVVYVLEKCNKE